MKASSFGTSVTLRTPRLLNSKVSLSFQLGKTPQPPSEKWKEEARGSSRSWPLRTPPGGQPESTTCLPSRQHHRQSKIASTTPPCCLKHHSKKGVAEEAHNLRRAPTSPPRSLQAMPASSNLQPRSTHHRAALCFSRTASINSLETS